MYFTTVVNMQIIGRNGGSAFYLHNAHLLFIYDLCVYRTDARTFWSSTYSHIMHSSGDARVCLYLFEDK